MQFLNNDSELIVIIIKLSLFIIFFIILIRILMEEEKKNLHEISFGIPVDLSTDEQGTIESCNALESQMQNLQINKPPVTKSVACQTEERDWQYHLYFSTIISEARKVKALGMCSKVCKGSACPQWHLTSLA